jgi:uncharacterized protein YgiM (DUF1202 family)
MIRRSSPITRRRLVILTGLVLMLAAAAFRRTPVEALRAAQPAPVPTAAAPAALPFEATVTAPSLNLRSGPHISFTAVTYLMEGNRVRVVGRNPQATWAQVELPNRFRGWVNARYLRTDRPLEGLPIAVVPMPDATALVTGEKLYLYAGPSAAYRTLVLTRPGDRLRLHGRDDRAVWLFVTVEGGPSGWGPADGPMVLSVPARDLPILYPFIGSAYRIPVHDAPDATSEVIGEVYAGQSLSVLGQSADGSWAQIRLAGARTGWVPAETLRPPSGVSPFAEQPASGKGNLSSESVAGNEAAPATPASGDAPAVSLPGGSDSTVVPYVFIYDAPRQDAEALVSLVPGQTIVLLGRTDDFKWIKVSLPGAVTGWLEAEALQAQFPLGRLPVVAP